MRTATEEEIVAEVRRSIEKHGCSLQRYRQLRAELAGRRGTLVGDALLRCWDEAGEHFDAQKFIASLLFFLNPPTTRPLASILPYLTAWNLSVSHLPWYLALQFGEQRLLEELSTLEAERGDPAFVRTAATVRFWIQADYHAEHGPTSEEQI